MSRENRPKLSELMNTRQPFFATRVDTFEEAYPTVEKVQVEVTETQGFRGTSWTQKLNERSFTDAIDCTNPLCYGGGISIGSILHNMVRDGQTSLEETKSCRGYEGSPKGRRRYDRCAHSFRVMMQVEYRKGGEGAASSP